MREAGFEAEGLAVHDEITVGRTLVRLAAERDAPAVVVGSHGHRAVRELVMGSTTQEVVRHAPCPALVVRGPKDEKNEGDEG
jgi:nucleotide-binding universal stress UspA family protein